MMEGASVCVIHKANVSEHEQSGKTPQFDVWIASEGVWGALRGVLACKSASKHIVCVDEMSKVDSSGLG